MGEGTYLENNVLSYWTPTKQGTQGAYSTQQLHRESCHFSCPLQPTQLLCLSSEKQSQHHGAKNLIKNETKPWSTLPSAIILGDWFPTSRELPLEISFLRSGGYQKPSFLFRVITFIGMCITERGNLKFTSHNDAFSDAMWDLKKNLNFKLWEQEITYTVSNSDRKRHCSTNKQKKSLEQSFSIFRSYILLMLCCLLGKMCSE